MPEGLAGQPVAVRIVRIADASRVRIVNGTPYRSPGCSAMAYRTLAPLLGRSRSPASVSAMYVFLS